MHGYYTIGISLDSKAKDSEIDFISHAHTDHTSAAKSSNSMLMSNETGSLLEEIYGIQTKGKIVRHVKNLKLLEAGHILGSKQLVINDEVLGKKIIYSGDFQMEKPVASKPIEIESADTLILDSTYPQYGLKFDEKNEVGEKFVKWVKERLETGIVIINAYAIGKAQELIKMLNEDNIVPVVSNKISKACDVYNRYSFNLKTVSAFAEDTEYESALSRNFVGVTEKNAKKLAMALHEIYGKRVFTAIATGFSAMYKFDTDAQFTISDHADFYQRLDYINEVSPRDIFTYGKDSEVLANTLKKAGYKAEPYNKRVFSTNIIVELNEERLRV
ncbi:MAG: hypothetical protein QXK65_00510 [Candidatus Micrarchaeaceae archaeon]